MCLHCSGTMEPELVCATLPMHTPNDVLGHGDNPPPISLSGRVPRPLSTRESMSAKLPLALRWSF